jgi:hypothetical protein
VTVWGQPAVKEMLGMDVEGKDLTTPTVLSDFATHKVAVAACDSQVVVVVEGKASGTEVCAACSEPG